MSLSWSSFQRCGREGVSLIEVVLNQKWDNGGERETNDHRVNTLGGEKQDEAGSGWDRKRPEGKTVREMGVFPAIAR
jgi:hypothetical protein